jgi:hypothetical protein
VRRFALCAAAATLLCAACGSTVSEEELARRIEASRPTWQSYSEEIKAQLGAGPAAEWEGTLREVRVEPDRILVTFALEGPWARRQAAAPVLLNEPLAGVRMNRSAERDGDRVTYAFPIPPDKASLPVPWVEVKFPRGQRRVALSGEGRWSLP